MLTRTLAAALLVAFSWAGQAPAQAPVAGLQIINARQGSTVDVQFDTHPLRTGFAYRETTGQLRTLYGTHAVTVIDGADTLNTSVRLATGQEHHIFVVPGGILMKEDVRAAASVSGMSEMYLVNLTALAANVRVLDALRDNAVLDTVAMGTGQGETTRYVSVRTSEWNFEVTSPDTALYETYYLDAMTNFNLSQWPLVLVLDNAASGQRLKLSVLHGRHQLLFEDLAVSTRRSYRRQTRYHRTFTLLGNYPNPFNPGHHDRDRARRAGARECNAVRPPGAGSAGPAGPRPGTRAAGHGHRRRHAALRPVCLPGSGARWRSARQSVRHGQMTLSK